MYCGKGACKGTRGTTSYLSHGGAGDAVGEPMLLRA